MYRVVFRHGNFRQARFRALSAAGAADLTDFINGDSLVLIRARRRCTTIILSFQAGFGSLAQADFTTDPADYAFFFIRFQGANFEVRIGDVGLAHFRAVAAARAARYAAHLAA